MRARVKLTWRCMFTPRLFKIYRNGPLDSTYQPTKLEQWGDKVITTANTGLTVCMFTSPLILMYIYKRGFFSWDEALNISKIFGGVSCLMAISFLMRAIGRACNPVYVEFMRTLKFGRIHRTYTAALRDYDFEFHAWPVSYAVAPTKYRPSWLQNHPFKNCANEDLPVYQRAVIQILAYVAAHTFGIRLAYPGCIKLVHKLLALPLFQGRTSLVETYRGKRSKVATADGNFIDTMFIDNRNKSPKGEILVICSEGNSGFYEIGIMGTPMKAGYSSLGWNHPGFAASTGVPYPSQEHNAIDAVTQYAINKLDFDPQQIVMYGWSIGGYTATWAAVNYPVKGLILDATFDDLLYLALNQMPNSLRRLVKEAIRSYLNLNVAELLNQYSGPVRLVRRTEDEIICLRLGLLSSNRGNDLLLKLLEKRHPEMCALVKESGVAPLDKFIALLESHRAALERSELADIDRRALHMIGRYMRDYKSSHCTPLPEQMFEAIMSTIIHN